MLKRNQRSDAVALVSAFWGLLLTCVTFSFIVWSPHPGDDGSDEEYLSMALFCEVCILTLGCIQTTFSFILFLASPKYKRSWTTAWICSHVVILLGLLLFYTIHTYTTGTYLPTTLRSSKTGDYRATGTDSGNGHDLIWILHENNPTTVLEADLDIGNILTISGSDSSGSGTGSVQSGISSFSYYKFARFTSLDVTMLFDFLFLTIIFVCTLCESESPDSNSSGGDNGYGYGNRRPVTVIAPAAPIAGGANRIQKFKSNNTSINQTKNNLNNNNFTYNSMNSITGLSLENERRGNSQFWNFPRRQSQNPAPSVNSISGSVHNFPPNGNDRGTGRAVRATPTINSNSINGYDFKPFQENLI